MKLDTSESTEKVNLALLYFLDSCESWPKNLIILKDIIWMNE